MSLFTGISDKLNRLLYQREMDRLSQTEAELANLWTLQLIREAHPNWSEEQVQKYFDNLLHLRVVVVDAFASRNS